MLHQNREKGVDDLTAVIVALWGAPVTSDELQFLRSALEMGATVERQMGRHAAAQEDICTGLPTPDSTSEPIRLVRRLLWAAKDRPL